MPKKFLTKCANIALTALLIATLSIAMTSCSDQNTSSEKHEINIGLTLAPTNLDIRKTSGSAIEQILLDNVYEGLVTMDKDAKVVPAIAKSWDISEDGLEYTFHLNDGVHFSDGKEVTSNNVVDSIKDVKDNELNGYKSLEKLKGIKSLDAKTVEFTLFDKDPEFLWTLSGRVGIVVDTENGLDYKTSAYGTGPFTLESWDGTTNLTLKKNQNYWGTPAIIDTVNISYITDKNAAVNALESGTIDILAPIVEKLAAPLKDNGDYITEIGEGTDKFELGFNNAAEPLNDLKVRQAIRYAIDHNELIANRGSADALLGGPITKTEPGFEDLTALYPYDPDKAVELLRSAGYGTNNPLTLDLKYATDIYGTDLGELLTSQFAKVGIELNVVSQDFPTWLDDVYKKHNYQLTIVDQNDPRAFYHWNMPDYYYEYDNPDVQDLYKRAASSSSEEEEGKLLSKAARIVSEDAASDWLFNYRTTVIRRSNIEGLRTNFNQSRLPLKDLHYTD